MSTTSSRVWLITGANSGLGLALSLYALSNGDKVIAAARDVSKLPASLKDATPFRIDLNDSDAEIIKAGQEAWSIHGHIDVLCNNAGYGHNAVVEDITFVTLYKHYTDN
jgi:NAD(P)-dependent dehydrogenase (short-subunit alcohol dehydrogenase family)